MDSISNPDEQKDSINRLREYVREFKLLRGEVFVDIDETKDKNVSEVDPNSASASASTATKGASSTSSPFSSCSKTNSKRYPKHLPDPAKIFMDNVSISSSSTLSDDDSDMFGLRPLFFIESTRVSMSSDNEEDPLPFRMDDSIYNDWDSGLSHSSIELSRDDNNDNRSWGNGINAVPPDDLGTGLIDFPHRALRFMECQICLEMDYLRRRVCCDFQICNKCLVMYLTGKVTDGKVQIECANDRCNALMFKDEIRQRLPLEMREKFIRFLIDQNKDPHVKTCPSCSSPFEIDPALLKVKKKKLKYGIKVVCTQCRLNWCFRCQAPFHTNVSCKKYRSEDEMVKRWAKEKHYGQFNAQKCPKCKIFVQKMDGCDHMKCSQCKTNFCYKCGDRYISVKFFGSHWNRFSLFGCKYRLMPEKNGLRRLIRGSHFVGRVLAAVLFAVLGVAAGAVLVAGSVVILPGYGIFVLRRRMWAAKQRKKCDRFKMRMISMAEKQQALIEKLNGNLETVVEESEAETLEQVPDPQQIQVIVHQPEEEVLALDVSNVNGEVIVNKYTNEDLDVMEGNDGATSMRDEVALRNLKQDSDEGRRTNTKLVFNILSSLKNEDEEEVEGNVESGIICDDEDDENDADDSGDSGHVLEKKTNEVSENCCNGDEFVFPDLEIKDKKTDFEKELNLSDLNSLQCLSVSDKGDSKDAMLSSGISVRGNTNENTDQCLISSDVQHNHSLSKGDENIGDKLTLKKVLKVDSENKSTIPLKMYGENGDKGCFGNIFNVGKRTTGILSTTTSISNEEDTLKSNKEKLFPLGRRKSATWEKCRNRSKVEIDSSWVDKSSAIIADKKFVNNLPLMVRRSSSTFSSIVGHNFIGVDEIDKKRDDDNAGILDSETAAVECETGHSEHVKRINFEITDIVVDPSKHLPKEHFSQNNVSQISEVTHL